MPLFTFGHGTADRDRLLELLRTAGIRELVDVRTAPGSRRNPDVRHDDAAHMRTQDFLDAVRNLLQQARDQATTVFCSESVWWRCHRRMIADFAVLSAQMPVLHLMHDGQVHQHRPMDVARVQADGFLVYDGREAAG